MASSPLNRLLTTTKKRLIALAMSACLAFALWIVWHASVHLPLWGNQPLRVWFLDVGQGDGILIQTPNGHDFLLDGGPGKGVVSKLGFILSPFDRELDGAFITHAHADHMDGVLATDVTYTFDRLYVSDGTLSDASFQEKQQDQSTPVIPISRGWTWQADGVKLTLLDPSANQTSKDPNDISLVLLLEYGNTRILFTGDTTEQQEQDFVSLVGDIDVLKVAHHGSNTSSSWNFLKQITPETAIISVGENNTYNHPNPIILERLKEQGIQIYRTDKLGDILLTSYGDEPTVQAVRVGF